MENTLRHLRALYPDAFPDAPAAPAPLLDADPAVRAEAEALAEAKFYLDLRAPSRPDAATLDAVMDAAAFAASAPQPGRGRRSRTDRPALARRSRRVRRMGLVLATALTVVLGVGVVLRPSAPPAPAVAAPPAATPTGAMQAAPILASAPPTAAETITPIQVDAVAQRPAAPPTEWSATDDEAQRIDRDLDRLETLAADLADDLGADLATVGRSDLDALFDTPARRLEAAPTASRAASPAARVPADGKGSYHAVLARRNR